MLQKKIHIGKIFLIMIVILLEKINNLELKSMTLEGKLSKMNENVLINDFFQFLINLLDLM